MSGDLFADDRPLPRTGCPCAATTADRVDISRDGRCVTCPVTRHDEPAEGDVAGAAESAHMTPEELSDVRKAFDRDVWANEFNSLPTAVDRLLRDRADALRDLLAAAEQRGRVAALREAAAEWSSASVPTNLRAWLTARADATERAQ